MTDEDILNALEDINSILDGYIERVNRLEFNNPETPKYYKQFLKSIQKLDRCIGGIVLPTEGECDCPTTPDTGNPEVPIISCEGATEQIEIFPDLDYGDYDGYSGTIHWDVEVDGTLYQANAGLIAGDTWIYLEEWILSNLNSILSAYYVSGLVIKNIDSIPHRIRLIPDTLPENFSADRLNNPTFSIDAQTGIISFCLAPKP